MEEDLKVAFTERANAKRAVTNAITKLSTAISLNETNESLDKLCDALEAAFDFFCQLML